MKSATPLALALLLSGVTLSRAQDGAIRVIAQTGTATPGLGVTFLNFDTPVINGSGSVVLLGRTGLDEGIYITSATGLVALATTAQTAPVIGSLFGTFSRPLINENGLVAFYAQNVTATGQGIYTSTGGGPIAVAATGQAGQGFTSFPSATLQLSLSDTGTVAFRADKVPSDPDKGGLYVGTAGSVTNLTTLATTAQMVPGTATKFTTLAAPVLNNVGVAALVDSSHGIYTSVGSSKMTIATTTTTVPVIGGNFPSFGSGLAINDKGSVAFTARNNGAGYGKNGIFVGSGGALSAIATSDDIVPGLGGTFTRFSDPSLNSSGTVAFGAESSTWESGIFKGNGGALQALALTTQVRPYGSGRFTVLEKPAVNNGGTVAFLGTSGDGSGIYLGDGQQLIAAAYQGQSVAGSMITSVNFAGGSDRGGASQFNDNGQVTYHATLDNGTKTAVLLFTPTLHYRTATSGSWGARSNWTVSLQPAAVHDVFIDPATSLTVSGPAVPTTVKSLTINGSGAATATLALQNYGTLNTTDGLILGPRGVLTGNGKVKGSVVTTAGTISPTAGATLTLAGAISGTSLTTNGLGTVNLEGAQNYATLNALAGTTNVRGSFTGGTATINANATTNFSASQTIGALNIGAGAVVTLNSSAPFAANAALLSSRTQVVPEPGTISLLAISVLGAISRRRRATR